MPIIDDDWFECDICHDVFNHNENSYGSHGEIFCERCFKKLSKEDKEEILN